MSEPTVDFSGLKIIARSIQTEEDSSAAEIQVDEITSTSTNTTIGPGTLAEVLVEILDEIETKADA